MTDTTVGISIFFPPVSRPFNSDIGREETLIQNLSFSNIVMDKICSNSVLIHIHENENVRIKAVKDLFFSDIHARALNFPKIVGRETAILENVRFSDCTFVKIDKEEIPNRFAHGATTYNDDLYHPFEIRYADVTCNNCRITVK